MARYVHPHFQRQSNALRVASYDNAKAKHETAGAEVRSRPCWARSRSYEQAKAQGQKACMALPDRRPPARLMIMSRAWRLAVQMNMTRPQPSRTPA